MNRDADMHSGADLAQALADERRRIITDIHDGLGASLVSLLRYVQTGNADARSLEQRVRAVLQELRIAVDALEPADGDLGAVLGKLRHRLEPLVESSGVRFLWHVGELPRIAALDPAAALSIQRIVREAVANALKHSGASRITVSARETKAGGAEIRIEDDGRGFDPSTPSRGVGIESLHARASRLGASLDVRSAPHAGTSVVLAVPGRIADVPASSIPGPAPAAGADRASITLALTAGSLPCDPS